ncbi:hypothetical protein [Dorea formicigenerans]|uniref:hypothetical protein n=1 Tax=Dorea formicigenerans TaxID=39486 RepID=UPI00164E3DDD|nr:hypothetical protein [Dorea formicigenerans]
MIKEVDIGSEVAIPEQLLKGCSDSVVAFVADDGNHFTDYGIFEGMILFFDTKKSFEKGRLSCYVNEQENDQPKIYLYGVYRRRSSASGTISGAGRPVGKTYLYPGYESKCRWI